MNQLLQKLMLGKNLSTEEALQTIYFLLDDDIADTQKAAVLVLLRSKGETLAELSAFTQVLRANRHAFTLPYPVLDFVGTGGDHLHTVNISTASALLTAACGVKTLKHGNRSVSSLSGSSDVLIALGIPIDLTVEQTKQCLATHHFGFCFAPHYHQALKKLSALRQEIKVPTTINLLGPLLHPAQQVHLVLGVADEQLIDTYAAILRQNHTPRSVIVHHQGMDELSCLGPMQITEINGNCCKKYVLDPKQLGLKKCSFNDLAGKDPHYNATYIRQTFSGEETGLTDTLLLNAAMGLYLYQAEHSLPDALSKARSILLSGAGKQLLKNLTGNHYE